MLGLSHHPTRSTPTLSRAIGEVLEYTRGLLRLFVLLFGLVHLPPQNLQQTLVFRQPKQVIDAILLAPTHQMFAAKSTIRTQHDVHVWPGLTDPSHDALNLFESPTGRINVAGPQSGTQRMIATKDVQRQKATVAIVAVEEATK